MDAARRRSGQPRACASTRPPDPRCPVRRPADALSTVNEPSARHWRTIHSSSTSPMSGARSIAVRKAVVHRRPRTTATSWSGTLGAITGNVVVAKDDILSSEHNLSISTPFPSTFSSRRHGAVLVVPARARDHLPGAPRALLHVTTRVVDAVAGHAAVTTAPEPGFGRAARGPTASSHRGPAEVEHLDAPDLAVVISRLHHEQTVIASLLTGHRPEVPRRKRRASR